MPLAEELRPFSDLIDFINDLSPLPWSYQGDVVASRGDVAVPLNGTLSWNGRRGTALLRGPERAPDLLRSPLRPGPFPIFREEDFLTVSPADAAWRARQAWVASVTRKMDFTGQGGWADLRIDFHSLDLGDPGVKTAAHALLLVGTGF